jgi:hypothetical protein
MTDPAAFDLSRLRAAMWPDGTGPERRVYALLDGARAPEIEHLVKTSGADHRCLYAGTLAPELAAVAPYLVHLVRESPATQVVLERAVGAAWGVFVVAYEGIETLRRHFRRFLRVRTESDEPLLFRFYDPRVLRAYLPTCTAIELEEIFGPAEELFYDAPAPNAVIAARRNDGRLIEQPL